MAEQPGKSNVSLCYLLGNENWRGRWGETETWREVSRAKTEADGREVAPRQRAPRIAGSHTKPEETRRDSQPR